MIEKIGIGFSFLLDLILGSVKEALKMIVITLLILAAILFGTITAVVAVVN